MALYDAFISYSHAKDKPIAAALQSAIQKLGKPWYRRRALRLFRDDTSLSATPHLWPTIELALGQSGHFLLLASPEAAASKWVNREVVYWLEHNSIDTLLIGLTDGDLAWDEKAGDFSARDNSPLPPALAKKFPSEPKWVDLRPYRDGADKGDARFTEAAADFAAAIRGMPKEDLLSQEVRQQRRALRLAVGAAASLLVLAVAAVTAGVLAYRAQQEAIAQRNRAEQTLAAATQTANSLVLDLAQRFRNTVGIPADLVKDILDRARALQDQLIKSGQVTRDLKRSEAAALVEAADSFLTIGDTQDALATAQQAQQISKDLLAADLNDPDRLHDLAVDDEAIGNALMDQRDLAGALKAFNDDLAVMQRINAIIPGNGELQAEISAVFNKIGSVQEVLGNFAGALQSYNESLAIIEKIAKSNPDNTQYQADLAATENFIGNVQREQGDLAGALKSYSDDLRILQGLANSNPSNAVWQRELSIAYNKVGDVHLDVALAPIRAGAPQNAQGELAAALQSYSAGLQVIDALARTDTGNTLWQTDLVGTYLRSGTVQQLQGNIAGALKSYQSGVSVLDGLVQADPHNVEWQHDQALAATKLAEAQRIQGDLSGALTSVQRALAVRKALAQSHPDSAESQYDLAESYGQIAGIYFQLKNPSDALAAVRQGQAIMEKLTTLAPDNSEWSGLLQLFNRTIARMGK